MKISVAGFKIEIDADNPYIYKMCQDYLIDDNEVCDFKVRPSEQEIQHLKDIDQENLPHDVHVFTAVLAAITEELFHRDSILFHAATVAVDNQVYAFSAKTGTGKSTHVRLWLEHFKERALVVNGDKPFLTRRGEEMMVAGSPWSGKENWQTNTILPLKAICFLERGETNTIRQLGHDEIVALLFPQLRLPEDAPTLTKVMDLLDWMLQKIPFYLLQCNISDEAVQVAYEAMSK